MSQSRIRIAKDKSELVKALVDSATAPFSTYADVIAFAASLGAEKGKRLQLEHIAKEPSPISLEIFISRGYDWLIKLLAINETEDLTILSSTEPSIIQERIVIFEEYANAGLERLQNELRSCVDYGDRLLLFINNTRFEKDTTSGEFDLTRFL